MNEINGPTHPEGYCYSREEDNPAIDDYAVCRTSIGLPSDIKAPSFLPKGFFLSHHPHILSSLSSYKDFVFYKERTLLFQLLFRYPLPFGSAFDLVASSPPSKPAIAARVSIIKSVVILFASLTYLFFQLTSFNLCQLQRQIPRHQVSCGLDSCYLQTSPSSLT